MKRAWRIILCDVTCVVAAETRGQAVAIAMRAARDAGYRPKWPDAVCRRLPEFDRWASADVTGRCCDEELVTLAAAGGAR